jgi:hypothetical protein
MLAHSASGQGYRLRLDTRLQAVAFRGVTFDSIPASDTVTGPSGGPRTQDGYAVSCQPGLPYCYFYRPGPAERSLPVVTTADLSLWGMGVPGLSVRVAARLGVDLGATSTWPGTAPAVQLLEAYADYATDRLTARAGRQFVTSRLGYEGFDGARIIVRDSRRLLEGGGFAGWGLERGVALPVTSPALNPLDDFQPRRRQLVAGVEGGWTGPWIDLHADYLREVDPDVSKFVSERVGVQSVVRPVPGVTVQAGSDWDLAMGQWGSAEVAATYTQARYSGTVGLRRYRPHFELWTIWGAFSPVPYHTWFARGSAHAAAWLDIHGQLERYRFSPAEVSTALVDVVSDGWRWGLDATTTRGRWALDAGYHAEFGTGASSAGFAGSLAYTAASRLTLVLQGSSLQRPLEFRFDDARLWSAGLGIQGDATPWLRLDLGATYYGEERRRPDRAAFDWNQLRVTARAVVVLGSGADLRSLPPGRPRSSP